MVSPIPSPPPIPSSAAPTSCPPPKPILSTPHDLAPHDPLQEEHLPYVEQHFPRQMSWYAPEGPQGAKESASRWIRENPWPALGIATAAGALLALLTGPAARGTSARAKALYRKCRSSGE